MKIKQRIKKLVQKIFFLLLIIMNQKAVKAKKTKFKLQKINTTIMKQYQYHSKLINSKKQSVKNNNKSKYLKQEKFRHLMKF